MFGYKLRYKMQRAGSPFYQEGLEVFFDSSGAALFVGAVLDLVDHFYGSFWGEVFVEVFVVEGCWGGAAGADAFEFDEGELTIFGGLADINAEFFFDGFGAGGRAAELAGD